VVARLVSALNEIGWITDFTQFSNAALTVQFEMPQDRIPRLRPALASLPLSLTSASLEVLPRLECATASPPSENVSGSLQVTFVHAEPDLRIPVPAVPG